MGRVVWGSVRTVRTSTRRRLPAGEVEDLEGQPGREQLVETGGVLTGDLLDPAQPALRAASEHQSTLPLHLSLWADTVCAEQDPLAPMLAALDESGRDSSEMVVRLMVPAGEAATARLGTGLSRLRAAGLGIGLDAADTYPQATLIDADPQVMVLAARHTTTLPAAPAALAGTAALAAATGSMLIGDGVEQPEQAGALLAHGVQLAQGDLLGPWHRRPTTRLIPAALLDELTTSTSRPEPTHGAAPATGPQPATLTDLAHPPVTMPEDVVGEAVRAVFADRPELTGLVFVDADRCPVLTLNHDRFMLAITGPFGYSLYADRPAAQLGDPPRTLSHDATLAQAMELLADSPIQRMYDDIVVIDSHHRCHGVLRVGDLVRDLARRRSATGSGGGSARVRHDGNP